MALAGQYRGILVPLILLCFLSSYFYLKVWSSIDPDSENGANPTVLNTVTKEAEEVIYRHHYHYQHHQQDKHEKQRQRKLKEQQRREMKEKQKQEKEKKRLAKLQKWQQLDMEPFPALISTNNARVAALNLKAFFKFCHVRRDQDLEWDRGQQPKTMAPQDTTKENGQKRPIDDNDFETYEEWTTYIQNKNSGQEQQQPRQQFQTEQAASSKTILSRKSNVRPLFWERPLEGWIVNHTAVLEPCNRERHTTAHCLSFLSQDHLYLIPSREARMMPDKMQNVAVAAISGEDAGDHDGASQKKDIELKTLYHSDGGLEQELGAATSTGPSRSGPKMHFHMFWRGAISDKLSLAAHAFLFTQPLDRAQLHLWIDSTDLPGGEAEDYAENPFAKDLISEHLKQFVKLHVWDQKAQESFAYPSTADVFVEKDEKWDQDQDQDRDQKQTARGSMVTKQSKTQAPPVALSDEARFMILYRYGGMYLDADVLLLRDMSPLFDAGMEFAYEWSNTEMYNTAVLRLDRSSSVARRILDGAKAKKKEIQDEQKGKKGEGDVEEDELATRHKRIMQSNKPKKRTRRKLSADLQQQKLQQNPSTSGSATTTEASTPASIQAAFHAKQKGNDEYHLGPGDSESLFASGVPLPATSISRYRHGKRGEMRPSEIYHPARLRGYLSPDSVKAEVGGGGKKDTLLNNGLIMMPTAIFDPLRLRVDHSESTQGLKDDKEKMMEDLETFPDAFTNVRAVCPAQQQQGQLKEGFPAGPEVFFTGAYAYNWHNNWLTPTEAKSWMGLMRKTYDEFLVGERPNLYGEWFRGYNEKLFKK
ncbi:hypothetical protein EDD11_010046 [Mortierella claussenii]|nr:hypothetical protein EDD11_010046 [Mortierella claussenii]